MSNNKLNGLYLVVDPSMDHEVLLEKVEESLKGGVEILQIWNRWPEGMSQYDKEQLVTYIIGMAEKYGVPVLVNDDWELLQSTDLDGIHFDSKPNGFDRIREKVGRDFIAGITCSNDLEVIKWAEEKGFDYVSFCAMFPSSSVGSCEIVRPETVRKAREITDMPLFLSGGITPEKIKELSELDFNGVAVISGVLKDDEPRKKASNYNQALNNR
ncbi:thiamine phosphate synthase [Fodinibius sp. AD559]|uniref:thiamine phosphate synthase n=1 Tax=Fodinibius sp. AD559 TaxID=3424179 RepID=UPI0040469556